MQHRRYSTRREAVLQNELTVFFYPFYRTFKTSLEIPKVNMHKRNQEKNSGHCIKMTLSGKWPIALTLTEK